MTLPDGGPLFRQPHDLPAWHQWQRSQQPWARRIKSRLRPASQSTRWLVTGGEPIHTLVALESFGPTQLSALVEPMASRPGLSGIGYLVPAPDHPELPGLGEHIMREEVADAPGQPPVALVDLAQVLAVGDYLGSGRLARHWALQTGARFVVAQHGLLAHQAPPLPADCELMAYTDQDAAWWTTDRPDVQTSTVGLQILWNAVDRTSSDPETVSSHDAPGVFLGQLHGAELSRGDFARAALEYCRATGAVYRPHPAETDRLSRMMHAWWEKRGVQIDRSGRPLKQSRGPVAAVFSTGVLEAAYAGRDAWVVHRDPPAWLEGFWDRYGLSRWTPHEPAPAPTRPPELPATAPARSIADHLFGTETP